jgi:nucleoside phosphorylase
VSEVVRTRQDGIESQDRTRRPDSADQPDVTEQGDAPSASMIEHTRGTAVILTALGLEYTAVREHLGQRLEEREERGTLYEIGTFTGRRGTWTVAIAETGEGNTTAGIQLERAAQVFSPQVVLFVGVAGGRKDVKLGDVVAADAVYDYEAGKDTRSRYFPRIKTAAPSHRLVQHARAVARRGRWRERIKPAPPQPPPAALVKPIAAGGKVVAHDRSRIARLLAQSCGDAVAVDMESYGFLHGAYANEGVSALVVRGVSDLLTGKKEESDRHWQPAAARP